MLLHEQGKGFDFRRSFVDPAQAKCNIFLENIVEGTQHLTQMENRRILRSQLSRFIGMNVSEVKPSAEQLFLSQMQAHANSMIHHSNLTDSFSVSFVNIYAIFNAGAFAAYAAIIPTHFGRLIVKNLYTQVLITFILFSVGFFSAGALKAILLQYTIKKYKFYRYKLNNKEIDNPGTNVLLGFAVSLLVVMIVVTITGVFFAISILFTKLK